MVLQVVPSGRREAGLQILRFKIRHFIQDLRGRQSSREEIEDIAHANAHSADARSAAALLGINGDSIGNLIHVASITGRSVSAVRCRLGDRDRVLIATHEVDRIAGSNLALLCDREVEAAAAAAVEALDHVRASEADGELETRHARLRDDELRAPDREAVADVQVILDQACDGEVLAERAPRQLEIRQFLSPEFVVLGRIDVTAFSTPP